MRGIATDEFRSCELSTWGSSKPQSLTHTGYAKSSSPWHSLPPDIHVKATPDSELTNRTPTFSHDAQSYSPKANFKTTNNDMLGFPPQGQFHFPPRPISFSPSISKLIYQHREQRSACVDCFPRAVGGSLTPFQPQYLLSTFPPSSCSLCKRSREVRPHKASLEKFDWLPNEKNRNTDVCSPTLIPAPTPPSQRAVGFARCFGA